VTTLVDNAPVPRPVDVLQAARRRTAMTNIAVVAGLLAAFSVWAIADGGLTLYLQRVLDGTRNGVLYGMVALALVIVFKATKVINFAQGSMAMFGTFVAATLIDAWNFPVFLAVVVAMALSAVAGAGLERAFVRPFDPDNHLGIVIVTLSLYLAINAAAALIWGNDPRGFPSLFPAGGDNYLTLGQLRIYYTTLGTWITIALVVVVLHQVLARTRMGLAFRTVANSVENARLVGVDVGRTVQRSWAIAAAVGTLAGCLLAPMTNLDPTFMDKVLVYSFAAATLGGLDSIAGSVLGGLVVGLTIALLTGYIPGLGGEFGIALAFFVIVAVLQLRPAGLLGRRTQERV
jgi:branched-chain amino acid transport system permease protein